MTEVAMGLALSLLLAATAPDEERTVCVPDDYGGWECGKGAQAPLPRSVPASVLQGTERASAPPPYLMDPARRPTVTHESLDRGYVSPQATNAAPARSSAAPTIPATAEPVSAPVNSGAASVAAPAPIVPPPTTVAAAPAVPPAEEPSAVASSAPAAEVSTPTLLAPATSAPERKEAQATSGADPKRPALRPQRIISSVARESDELLALPDSYFTVQLSATRGVGGFVALRQKFGIAVEDTFVIRVKRGEDFLWLMLWRDFPDLASARAAIKLLPDSKGIWARPLAPIKAEIRATPD